MVFTSLGDLSYLLLSYYVCMGATPMNVEIKLIMKTFASLRYICSTQMPMLCSLQTIW